MRLENVLALTHGKLVNKPFVNTFTNVVFDSKAVKRGDLFLAFDEESIDDAIFNGAYGIVFSKPTQISDSEIAWIKVQSIEESLKRLLRFKLIEKDIHVYESNEIVLKLALQIITEVNFIALKGDVKDVFKQLWNIEERSTILFCPTLTDKDIFTKTVKLSTNISTHINIIEQTLFETSFIYDDIFYERQQISPFFISYLEILLDLFKSLKINYRLKKFIPIDNFEAVFTNNKFEIKEFGSSDKVLIFEKNHSFIESEILFLEKEASWAKIIYLTPQKEKYLLNRLKDKSSLILYNQENEIIPFLEKYDFHFALIIGTDKSILSEPIKNQREVSLFDL